MPCVWFRTFGFPSHSPLFPLSTINGVTHKTPQSSPPHSFTHIISTHSTPPPSTHHHANVPRPRKQGARRRSQSIRGSLIKPTIISPHTHNHTSSFLSPTTSIHHKAHHPTLSHLAKPNRQPSNQPPGHS